MRDTLGKQGALLKVSDLLENRDPPESGTGTFGKPGPSWKNGTLLENRDHLGKSEPGLCISNVCLNQKNKYWKDGGLVQCGEVYPKEVNQLLNALSVRMQIDRG